MRQGMKVRSLLGLLRRLGCRIERTRGSHQIWKTPKGTPLTVVVNHANDEVTPAVLGSVRRALRRDGLLVDAICEGRR
jgi:predicted RNA binding protein YcfA (HicA-like mRNA interferase family)